MCGPWALVGECTANPNYMVGRRESGLPGHCLRSCGRCPSFDPMRGVPPRLAAPLRNLRDEQLRAFVHAACGGLCGARLDCSRGKRSLTASRCGGGMSLKLVYIPVLHLCAATCAKLGQLWCQTEGVTCLQMMMRN
jgi:hypothetical protein